MKKFTKDEMAMGYVEMGAINLSISQECFEAENQAMAKLGDAYYEMDKEKCEGDTE